MKVARHLLAFVAVVYCVLNNMRRRRHGCAERPVLPDHVNLEQSHQRVDPAALLVTVLVFGFTPVSEDGPWDLTNTLTAAVVGVVLWGYTWPRQWDRSRFDRRMVLAHAVIYGFVFAVGLAFPVQLLLDESFSALQCENLWDRATDVALIAGALATAAFFYSLSKKTAHRR